MFRKTLLVAVLIAASLVAESTMTSASAQTLEELAKAGPAQQREIIETIIWETFPENAAPRMIAIANCESTNVQHVTRSGELVRSPSRAYVGVLQVAESVHRPEINRLLREEGRDVLGDVREYVRFTRYLYDYAHRHNRNGFAPWPSCSRNRVTHTQQQAAGRSRNNIVLAQAH